MTKKAYDVTCLTVWIARTELGGRVGFSEISGKFMKETPAWHGEKELTFCQKFFGY